MASTLNLPYVRYVKQVSNGFARSKYSYQGMQTDLLEQLKTTPWKVATCALNKVTTVTNKVAATDGEYDEESGDITTPPTYTYYLQDRFDAFKQGGDANVSDATMCGYAGMVAYRYKLPTQQSSNINQVILNFSMSRYLRSGLRVCVKLSDDSSPSNDWSVIRGDASGSIVTEHTDVQGVVGLKSNGWKNQDCWTLLETRAQEGELIFKATDFPSLATTTRYAYMYVYVSIEDYEDYWEMYDVGTPRYYSIEGSAQLVGKSTLVKFEGTETEVDDAVYGGSWSLPNGPNITTADKEQYEDVISAFGNFCRPTMKSCVFTTPDYNYAYNGTGHGANPYSPLGRLLALDSIKEKENCMFDTEALDIQDSYGQSQERKLDSVPYADIDRFGVVRQGWVSMYDSQTRKYYYYPKAENAREDIFGIEFKLSDKGPSFFSDCVQYPLKASFSYRAIDVPCGKATYNTLRVKIEAVTRNGTTLNVGMNVWKSTSQSIKSIYSRAAFCTLGSKTAFFTGSKNKVEGQITGDGTLTDGVLITASANLIGYADMNDIITSGQILEIPLSTNVVPGDVVIMTPRLNDIVFENTYSTQPQLPMTGKFLLSYLVYFV